jgi:hypothetical protein
MKRVIQVRKFDLELWATIRRRAVLNRRSASEELQYGVRTFLDSLPEEELPPGYRASLESLPEEGLPEKPATPSLATWQRTPYGWASRSGGDEP